jgi:hypothetical protein
MQLAKTTVFKIFEFFRLKLICWLRQHQHFKVKKKKKISPKMFKPTMLLSARVLFI